MQTDQDQDELVTLLQNNRLLRRTYRQMNEELQALSSILQQKLQRSPPSGAGCLQSALPAFWLLQNEDHLYTLEEIQSLQRSNAKLHQLNATLAQMQMTAFKKLLDITQPERRPEKQTQTRSEAPGVGREAALRSLKEDLQKELQQLRMETGAAQKAERLARSRRNCLRVCVHVTELHNSHRRQLLEQVRENRDLELQVRMLEEELQHRRSVTPPAL